MEITFDFRMHPIIGAKTRVSWPVGSRITITGIEANNAFDPESMARQAEKFKTIEKIAFFFFFRNAPSIYVLLSTF